MARDVEELLDFLKIEKALIGGLSMGGYVALNLFPLCSQRFAGLILCDTTSSADNQEKRKTRKKLIEEIILHGIGVLKTKMLPNLISGITQKNNPQLIAQLEKEIAGVSPDAAISALRGMAERDDQTNSLTKIDVPTLLIFGAEDQITDLEAAHILQQKISNSELFILEKAGHLSNLEQPEKFNKAVLKFCKKISS